MAPEVIKGLEYNTMGDVYSIGIIMSEVFCIDSNTFNQYVIINIYESSIISLLL